MSGNVLTRLLERIFLKNSAGTTINPATEDKQDDIIAVLGTPRQEDGHGSAYSTPSQIVLPQAISAGNTQVVTSAQASPSSPWIGAWEETRDAGIARVLTVLAATDSEISGTFTFEFTESDDPEVDHPSLGTAEISESKPIGDFDTVRDFDLLNVGKYYRVAFEPTNALGSESVTITTTLRRQNDGAYVRFASQEIEQSNAAMPQTFAYQKAFNVAGKSVNIGGQGRDTGNSSTTPLDGDATFRGVWRNWEERFVGTQIDMVADVDGELFIDFSQTESPTDGVDDDVTESFGPITYDPVDTPLLRRYFPTQSRWVRTRYINGPVGQASFDLSTVFFGVSLSSGLKPAVIDIDSRALTAMMDAVLSAEHADTPGTFRHLKYSDDAVTGERGLQAQVTGHTAETPVRPLDNYRTFQGTALASAAVPIPPAGTGMAGRKSIKFSNQSNTVNVWYGKTSGVTTLTGSIVRPGADEILELGPNLDFYWIAEDLGGTTLETDLSPTTTGGTGGSPGNIVSSNDAHATLSNGQTLLASDFAYTQTLATINALRARIEARKASSPAFQTIAHSQHVQNTGSGTSVTTGGTLINAGTNLCIVVYVANGESNPRTVAVLSGGGLTWHRATADLIGSENKAAISAWVAVGSPASAFSVLAQFSGDTEFCAISADVYTGVDQTSAANAIQDVLSAQAAGSGANDFSVGPVTGTATFGRFIGGINSNTNDPTVVSPTTLRTDLAVGGKVNMEVFDDAAAASNTFSGNHGGNTPDWVGIALTLRPAATQDIPILVEFDEGSGFINAGTITFSSTTDSVQEVDLTSLHSLTEAGINNTEVRLTRTSAGAALSEVDHVVLRVVEGNADTAVRISGTEVADTVYA